jgi:hypothetical protein
MNAFDLNRKEYCRINNSGGEGVTQFRKVSFLTSFVITGEAAYALPLSYDYNAIGTANGLLFRNAQDYCSDAYPDQDGYACYFAEIGVVNTSSDTNVPYGKVNVYAMDGRYFQVV